MEREEIGKLSPGLKGTPCGESEEREEAIESAGERMLVVAMESVGETMLEAVKVEEEGSVWMVSACRSPAIGC